MTTEGRVIAGRFALQGGEGECWSLPAYADITQWVGVATAEWRRQGREPFARISNWRDHPEWQSREERKLNIALTELRDAREAALKEFQTTEVDFLNRLSEAALVAEAGSLRLLTEKGDSLVESVVESLQYLGLVVTEMDTIFPEGDRREDLRVTLPENPDWVAIVEVRGYQRGAQLTDLIRLSARFQPRFVEEIGRRPDAMWYIVNHDLQVGPNEREEALASNPSELALFGEDGGLVIDSRSLFLLVRKVEDGEIDTDTARKLLVKGRERFELETEQ